MKQTQWKTLGRKRAEYLLNILKRVRDSATMERASFGGSDGEELTQVIKRETKIYRESWLLRPLDEVIDEIKTTYNL